MYMRATIVLMLYGYLPFKSWKMTGFNRCMINATPIAFTFHAKANALNQHAIILEYALTSSTEIASKNKPIRNKSMKDNKIKNHS